VLWRAVHSFWVGCFFVVGLASSGAGNARKWCSIARKWGATPANRALAPEFGEASLAIGIVTPASDAVSPTSQTGLAQFCAIAWKSGRTAWLWCTIAWQRAITAWLWFRIAWLSIQTAWPSSKTAWHTHLGFQILLHIHINQLAFQSTSDIIPLLCAVMVIIGYYISRKNYREEEQKWTGLWWSWFSVEDWQ